MFKFKTWIVNFEGQFLPLLCWENYSKFALPKTYMNGSLGFSSLQRLHQFYLKDHVLGFPVKVLSSFSFVLLFSKIYFKFLILKLSLLILLSLKKS